jgi:tetratricopeptide (TPR) repeat protein
LSGKVFVKRVLVVLGVVLLAAAGTAAAAFLFRGRREVTTSSSEALRYYRLGRENEQKLYHREALAAYAEALRHDPKFVMAAVHLARYLRERDVERAKSVISCAARFRNELTNREQLTLDIAQAQLARDEKKIEALASEYRNRYPRDPEGYQLRASLLEKAGKGDQAVAEYQRLLAVNPNYASAYNSLGYYFANRGDTVKAEDFFKRYRFLAPDQANPYDSLGELYARVGRYEEAEESLKKSLAIKPDFWQSVANLAAASIGRGDYGGAAQRYDQAAQMADNPSERMRMDGFAAISYALAGRADDAKKLLARVDGDLGSANESERKVLTAQALLLKASVLARVGEVEPAAALLAQYTPPAPPATLAGHDDKSSYAKDAERGKRTVAGLIAHAKGDWTEAAAAFQEAITERGEMLGNPQFPGDSLRRVLLAECLRQLGKADEAEGALKVVLARNPHFQPALTEMARVKEGTSETVARRS